MASIKSFEFASRRAAESKKKGSGLAGKFEVDGEIFEVRALRDTSIAYLVARVNDTEETTKVLAAVIDFMETAMTPESSKRFSKMALTPPPDGLEIDEVMEIFQHVLTLVAAGEDPTGSSSASSPSRRSTGASSTGTARSKA